MPTVLRFPGKGGSRRGRKMDEEAFEQRLAELHDRILRRSPEDRARLLVVEEEARRRQAEEPGGPRSGLQRLRHAAARLSFRYRMWLFDLEGRRTGRGWEG